MKFNIGDYVTNFNILGRVIYIRPDGGLILENVRIGRWIADPSKCTQYTECR